MAGWQSGEEIHRSSFLQILEALLGRREIPFVQRAESELMRRTDFKVLVQHEEHLSLSMSGRCGGEFSVILALIKQIQIPEDSLLSISGLVLSSEFYTLYPVAFLLSSSSMS